MPSWVTFACLSVKHYLLACVLDAGYSQARYRPTRHPWRPWLHHGLLEAALLVLLCQGLSLAGAVLVALAEALLMGVGCLAERCAPLQRALPTHVVCELSVLVFYAILTWGLLPPR